MYHASYYNVYINQRDAQILVNSLYFYFLKWLYMFRTIISPSLGAPFNKLYIAIGTRRYVWLLYGYSHAKQSVRNSLQRAQRQKNEPFG